MNGLTRISVALLAGVLACSPAVAQQPVYSGPPQHSLDPVAAAVAADVKGAHAAYNELRPVLIESGWKPVVIKQCLANVAGADKPKQCAEDPTAEECHVCDAYPELEACTGSGICQMQFSNPKSPLILRLNTLGDISQAEAMLQGWGFDKTPVKED